MGRTRSRTRTFVATAMAAVALTAVIAAPAHGAPGSNKTFTVQLNGTVGAALAVWSGDTNATINIVIKNTGPSQSLGSVNVGLPAPFALVSSPDDFVPGGSIVELRNLALAPGATVTKTMTVDVRTCVAGPSGNFNVTGKQSNSYSGEPGNDFVLVTAQSKLAVATTGACTLAFKDQPADAEVGAPITSVDYSPLAAAVSVEVRDAGGTGVIGTSTPVLGKITLGLSANPGAATLTDNGPVAPVLGVAKFKPKVSESASDYSLFATGTVDLVSSPSPSSSFFDIVDDQIACVNNGICKTQQPIQKDGLKVEANFSGPGPDTNLLVSVGAGDAPDFNCPNYPRNGAVVSQFHFATNSPGRVGTFDVTIPNASQPVSIYEVCWLAPYNFDIDGGGTAPDSGINDPDTGADLFVGTLPDCAKHGTVKLPCVDSRTYQKSTSSVKISVRTTGQDPWRY